DVDGDRRIGHVRRNVAVKVSLLHDAVTERDSALRHELRQAERRSRLELALDGERVDREPAVNRDRRAVNPGSLLFNRYVNGAGDAGPERFVAGDSERA